VHEGQRAGQLDAADGDGEHAEDLNDQQPAAGVDVLAQDGHPIAGTNQCVTQGERRLDRDQRPGLQAVLQQE
jgi:hypothetical protein